MHNSTKALRKTIALAAIFIGSTIACNSTSASPPSPSPSSAAPDPNSGNSTGTPGDGTDPSTTATGATSGTSGLYISGDPNCQSPSACPVASPALLVTLQNGALTGTTNEQSNWNFVAYDKNSTTRHIAILLSNIPADAYSDPTLQLGTVTSNVTVNWTPTIPTSGSLGVILRDWDRCLVTETDNTVCIHVEFNASYDTKVPAQPYIIAQQPGTGITCPTTNFLSGLVGYAKPPGC